MTIRLLSIYAEEFIQLAVCVVFGLLGITARRLLTRFVNTETKRKVAAHTVAYIAQVFTDLDGPQKLSQAQSTMLEILSGYGIDITAKELRVLIEAAYNAYKGQQPVFAPAFCSFESDTSAPEAETNAGQA